MLCLGMCSRSNHLRSQSVARTLLRLLPIPCTLTAARCQALRMLCSARGQIRTVALGRGAFCRLLAPSSPILCTGDTHTHGLSFTVVYSLLMSDKCKWCFSIRPEKIPLLLVVVYHQKKPAAKIFIGPSKILVQFLVCVHIFTGKNLVCCTFVLMSTV